MRGLGVWSSSSHNIAILARSCSLQSQEEQVRVMEVEVTGRSCVTTNAARCVARGTEHVANFAEAMMALILKLVCLQCYPRAQRMEAKCLRRFRCLKRHTTSRSIA